MNEITNVYVSKEFTIMAFTSMDLTFQPKFMGLPYVTVIYINSFL